MIDRDYYIQTKTIRVVCCLILASMMACAHGYGPRFPHSLILESAAGGRINFAHCEGKVTLVDFFTTWSQTSMVCVVGYSALYRKYADQGLCVIGVALDEFDETVEPFCKGMQVNYPVVLADDRIRHGKSAFGELSVVPVMMVFDHRGFLSQKIAGHVPIARLEKILVPLLRQMR